MNFHISLWIAISTVLTPTQERQKPGPQRPSVEQRSEIIVHTLPDLSGTWIIYDASEKVIPSPGNRLDLRFQRIEKLTAAAEEDTDVGAYTVIGIPGARKEVPFHSVKFDGETLRVRVGPIEFPDGRRREMPGLLMKIVGDHFEGYMTEPNGTQRGALLKLVKSKQQP